MRIIETTKQYMAVDSIIARPTNRVRVMVAEASGCCASEVSAVATARPSPSAGHIEPMPIVRPDVAIDTKATRVLLSIGSPLRLLRSQCWVAGCALTRGFGLR